jgi:hypothetical protein
VRRAVPLLVAVALAAGCGGSDAPLSQTEFAARANAICRDLYRHLNTLPDPRDSVTLADVMTEGRSYTEDALDDFDDLEPPASARAAFDGFLARIRDEVKLMEEVKDAAEANDLPKAMRVANRGTTLDAQANAAASRAGLKVCARPLPR